MTAFVERKIVPTLVGKKDTRDMVSFSSSSSPPNKMGLPEVEPSQSSCPKE
jgi:hypothetical protein